MEGKIKISEQNGTIPKVTEGRSVWKKYKKVIAT